MYHEYTGTTQRCDEVVLIQRTLSTTFWTEHGKIIGRYLQPLHSSILNRSHPFPLLNLSHLPTIEKPLRHIDQGVECTDRDGETHRSAKDDNVTRARPLARLLMISPVEILRQVSELRGA